MCVSSPVQHLTRRRCRKGRDRRRLEPRTSSPRHSGQSVLMIHTFSKTSRRVLLILLVPLLRVSRHDTQREPNPEMSGCHRAAKTPGQVTVQPYKGPGAWGSCVRRGTTTSVLTLNGLLATRPSKGQNYGTKTVDRKPSPFSSQCPRRITGAVVSVHLNIERV